MTATSPDSAAPAGVKELRLALVLYGGVSLAIYMHGASREIHRLVRGSAATDGEPASLTPSEHVYRRLIAAKAAEEKQAPTRVVVDTIAGTSAGGINGVYLAKALTRDLSQDALRGLWFERGDMEAIFRGPKWLPWKARVPWVIATIWMRPALDGDRMAGWLFDALGDMDRSPREEQVALLPDGHELELFVTLTDFHGYPRQLSLDDPPVVAELRHRHVMAFRYGRGHDDFAATQRHNAALAFAARATSSLPGGFPPVDFATFQRSLRRRAGVNVDLAALGQSPPFRQYALSGADVRDAAFVDGGVLDNQPFGHVIAAVQQKRADVEVDRRLVYLDPDPAEIRQRRGPRPPAPIAAALGALTSIRGHDPILDDVLALQARNERVRQLRAVIETNWDAVAASVADVLGADELANPSGEPDDARIADWRDRIHERALAESGPDYALYLRAKITDAVDNWAETICRLMSFPADCAQAAFVRAVLHEWADERDLFQRKHAAPTQAQIAFLRDFDLGYRKRRLRFLLAGLGWWYRQDDRPEPFPVPDRAQLDEASRVLSDAVEELAAAMRGEGLPDEVLERLADCFHEDRLEFYVSQGQPGIGLFLDSQASQLAELADAFRAHLQHRFAGFAARVYRELSRVASGWDDEVLRRLLVRYVGFPVWDALLFPYQAVAAVGEQDHVEVSRLSPQDTSLLPAMGEGAKLVGAAHHHLGAFFSRAGREQDYLWGRLDGAERLITLLLGRDHKDHDEWCQRAFVAILSEERDALPHASALIQHVEAHVDATVGEGTPA